MSTEAITLTPSELELIRLKREEEEIKKAKIEVENALKLERDIKNAGEEIKKDIESYETQVLEAERFFNNGLKENGWSLKIDTINRKSTVYRYNEKNEKVIAWEHTYTVKSASIVSSDGKYIVTVKKHIEYGKGFSSRPKEKGWVMTVEGPSISYSNSKKRLTNVKTVIKKVEEAKKEIQDKIDVKNEAENENQVVLDLLTSQFPTAVIMQDIDSNYQYSSQRGYKYRNWVVYLVTLSNGISFKATPESNNGEITYRMSEIKPKNDIGFPSFAEYLNDMKF